MLTQPDNDAWSKQHDVDEIEQEFLARAARYLAQQITYKDLAAYCISIILSQPSIRDIDTSIYQFILEIAVTAESQAVQERLQMHFDA